MLSIEPAIRFVVDPHWQIVSQRLQNTKFLLVTVFTPTITLEQNKMVRKESEGRVRCEIVVDQRFSTFSLM